MTISVIIPACNEGDLVQRLVSSLTGQPGVELIVALAEGDQQTTIPAGHEAKVVTAPKGRATQMNLGARAASGDILIFLHADTTIDPASFDTVRAALATAGVAGGAYRFRLDASRLSYSIITMLTNIRSRWLNLPYGDQAIFITRDLFEQIGGYPEIALMEDVCLVDEISRRGRLIILDHDAVTAARRWARRGVWRTTMSNLVILTAYRCGMNPEKLARWRK